MVKRNIVLLDIDYITYDEKPVIRLFGKAKGEKSNDLIANSKEIWPFANKRGIPDKCKVCNGSKYIEDYFVRCPHCNGTNKIYNADDGRGIPNDCKLCNKKGYVDFMTTPCNECDHTGRKWPFANKGGIPNISINLKK